MLPQVLLAERFVRAFDVFVVAVRAAVAAGVFNPEFSSTPAFLMWQTEALPRLEQENAEIQNAFALFQIGEVATLSRLAEFQLALAKHLDGFPLDFAGSDRAKALDQLETAVVVAAYQLCATSVRD